MNISTVVIQHIHQHPFLEEALCDGIINYAALARKLRPELESQLDRTVKEGAIIMALKRMSPTYYYKVTTGINDFLRRLGNFTVQSNINNYTYRNSPTLLKRQRKIFDLVAVHANVFFSFSQGIHESTIVASDVLHHDINDILSMEKQIAHQSNLACVSVLLPKDNTEVSGIYYYIFKQLAWQNINIVEVISTTNEFTIAVAEKDLDRSFSLLRGLTRRR